MHVREIESGSPEYRDVCALRQDVLRAPLGLDLYDEDLAAEEQHLHFGLFDTCDRLVACVIAVPRDPASARVRQMAVAPSRQGNGCGRLLMEHLERRLSALGFSHLSMHARATAEGLYTKRGYARSGEMFPEVGIPHIRMEKQLSIAGHRRG